MKKIISLMLAVMLAFSMLVVPVMAEGEPTATVTASLKGDVVPQAGERFYVQVVFDEISSGFYGNPQIAFEWPVEVAGLAVHAGTDVIEITDTDAVYNNNLMAIGGIVNRYGMDPITFLPTGKWTVTEDIDKTAGTGLLTTYVPQGVAQVADATTNRTMCELAFVLKDGQSFDDFYFTFNPATTKALLTENMDLSVVSTGENGALTLVGLEKKEEVVYESAIHQPGVDKGINTVDSGVYELPTTLTAGRTYEVTFKIHTHGIAGDTLVGLNNAAKMTGSNYYTNSTIMMKVDNDVIKFRNYDSLVDPAGRLSSTETTAEFKVVVDLINNTWGATVTENGAVVAEQAGMRFRNTGGFLPIDAFVLCDNNKNAGCLTATDIEVVDTTPASVGDVVFKYVTADGTVLETATLSGETGATIEAVAKTITDANGVKYEAPAASGVVGTDAEVTVTCAKVEVVTISYTVAGVEVATGTVEGVAGAEVAYNSGNIVTATGVYAKAGTIVVDAENLTAVVELDVVAEGLVSAAGQTADGIYTLEKQMTTAGTVTFDLTVLNPKDTLVALDNAVAVQVGAPDVNFFANSSAYIQLKDGSFMMNDGNGAQTVAAYEVGKTYSVEFVLDVTGKTYTVTVMDGETEVLKQEGFGMRNDVDVIDSLVIVDNAGAGVAAVVVSNLVVETEDEQPTEEVPSDDESEVPSDDESEVPSDDESEVPSDEESDVPSDEESDVPSDDESEVPSDDESEVPSDDESEVPSDDESEVPSDDESEVPSDDESEVPSDDESEVPSDDESEVPSDDESEVPSDDESEVPSDDESEVPSDDESEVPSDDESEVPSDDESEVPSDDESEVPSDDETEEPSEEPADLPYEAVDVVVTPSALGITVSGKFAVVDEEYEVTEKVVVVYSYLKDGKAYSVQAITVSVMDGEVELPPASLTVTEGELTLAGISLLTGVDALTAITTGNLGTPVGVWK